MFVQPAFTPILAHFGHWYFQLLYAVPVAVIVGVLTLQSWREGRERKARERDTKAAGTAPPPGATGG